MILTTLLALTLLGGILALFLYGSGADLLARRFNNPSLAPTLRWFAPYPLFALPLTVLEACLVSRERVLWLTVFNVVSRTVLMAALIAACLWTQRPDTLLVTQVSVTACMLVPAIVLLWRAYPSGPTRPRWGLLAHLAKYGLPLGAAGILGAMTLQLPGIIVSTMCSPEEFAVYSVGAFEVPLLGIVTGSIATVLLADMAKLIAEDRKQEALQLFATGALRSAALLLPAMCFLLVAAEPLIVLLFSEQYRDSVIPFRLCLLTLAARIVSWGSLLSAAGLNKATLIRSIGDLCVTAALSTLYVAWLGYYGALLGLLSALYLWSVPFNLVTVAKAFRCSIMSVLPIGSLCSILWRAGLPAVALHPLLQATWAPPVLLLTVAALLYGGLTYVLLRAAGLLPDLKSFRILRSAKISSEPGAPAAQRTIERRSLR